MNNISIYVHEFRKLYLGNCPFHIRTLNQHTLSNIMQKAWNVGVKRSQYI